MLYNLGENGIRQFCPRSNMNLPNGLVVLKKIISMVWGSKNDL